MSAASWGNSENDTITASYFDSDTVGTRAALSTNGTGYTTLELQAPTNYTGIYSAWNIDVDSGFFQGVDDGTMPSDLGADNPWDFSTT